MSHQLDQKWLNEGCTDSDELKVFYDGWATTYDETVKNWGYLAPERVAKTLFQLVPADSRLLDIGCGTGLSGEALRKVGFSSTIDGIDISGASLAEAEARGVYNSLTPVDLHSLPLPIEDDTYDALVCVGVLTYVSNDNALWPEFARILHGSGIALATQRTDLYKERDYDKLLDGLENYFSEIQTSSPAPYLPGNPQFPRDIEVIYISGKVS